MSNLQAMQVFIGAVYTGRLTLCESPPELAMEVYRLAHFYDCVHVQQLCESAVANLIDIDTVLDINEWSAGIEAATWTQRQVGRWIRNHFEEIAARQDVLAGLPSGRFEEVISSDFVKADEHCILRAIFDYSQAAEGAAEHLAQFLSHCRFPFVTEAALAALAPDERALIPDELLSERAAFQPMTRFGPGAGSASGGGAAQTPADPHAITSVRFTDSDGDVIEFRKVHVLSTGAQVVEQLVNEEREQLSVSTLAWNRDSNTLTDGPGVSTFSADSKPPLADLKALCSGTNCTFTEESTEDELDRLIGELEAEEDDLLPDFDDFHPGRARAGHFLQRQRSSGEQDRGHAAVAKASEEARLIRQRFLTTDEPRFRLRVYGTAAREIVSEGRARKRKIEAQRQRDFEQQQMLMMQRSSMMCCRMFHPTNGRSNFDKHTCDESVRKGLAAKHVDMPSADVVKHLLRTEKLLRLDPLTQIEYALPGQQSTELTNQLQLRIVRQAGLPDEAVNLIRSAQHLFPDDEDMKNIPHYVKFNRSKPGNLVVGSPAPPCSVVALSGQRSNLGEYFERSEQHGRPLVMIGGSFT
jgi:hypothetical protein